MRGTSNLQTLPVPVPDTKAPEGRDTDRQAQGHRVKYLDKPRLAKCLALQCLGAPTPTPPHHSLPAKSFCTKPR